MYVYHVEDLFNLVTLQILLVILATSVVPEHSLRQMVCQDMRDLRKRLNITSRIYWNTGCAILLGYFFAWKINFWAYFVACNILLGEFLTLK